MKAADHVRIANLNALADNNVVSLPLVQAGALDLLNEAVAIVAADGAITYANAAAAQLFGYTQQELTRHNAAALGISELRARYEKPASIRTRDGALMHCELHIREMSHQGRQYWICVWINPTTRPDAVGHIVDGSNGAGELAREQQAKQAHLALDRELLFLIEASSTLLASPDSPQVLRKIVELAQRFVASDAHAVWQKGSEREWALVSASGLSDRYIEHARLSGAWPIAAEPLLYQGGEQSNVSFERRRAEYEEEGIKSVLVVPLSIHGQIRGTVVYYWRTEHKVSEEEMRISKALANLAGAALSAAEVYAREIEAKKRAEDSERRSQFLAEAGLLLSSSLDYQATLLNVSKLAVPSFADWCAVDVLESGTLVRVTTQHPDPEMIVLAREFRRKHLAREDDPSLMVLRTGKALLAEDISDELLVQSARSPEHLADMRSLKLRSIILAPLIASEEVVGVITFAQSESQRHYGPDDLLVAEEIGRRAGAAIVHARLFREAKRVESALRLSNEELTHLNQDLKQFAFSASHDLQEPLRMVAVYSQLLEKRYGPVLDERARQFISFTVQGARRMEILIRDLLAYTLAASEPAPETVPLTEPDKVLDRVLLNLQAAIAESGAVVERKPVPAVRASEVHVMQLFQNLIGNAIKYRQQGRQPEVTISGTEEAGFVTLSVADNGIGIPPAYREQVFGLFKRLHTTEQYAGTGIGLAICQRLVQRYGGRIWVESNEGEGSVFRFTLPAGPPTTESR